MSLATSYRPQTFDDVIGQPEAVLACRNLGKPQAIMFTGSSGCGKTTLARIVARHTYGCEKPEEINGSDCTGVDDWRAIVEAQSFRSIDGKPRVIIVDECHFLSKSSWSSLLKPMEDAPSDWHWIFCTSELTKVPPANRNRCLRLDVKPLGIPDLERVIVAAVAKVGATLNESVIRIAAATAEGCPREALHMYELVANCSAESEAAAILGARDDDKDGCTRLARLIANGDLTEWSQVTDCIGNPTQAQALQYRGRIANYLAAVAFGQKPPEHVIMALELFTDPCPPDVAKATLALILAKFVYPDGN